MKKIDVLQRAREVFDDEIAGLVAVRDELGSGFEALIKACTETLDSGGKLVICGIGKSGHIGRKMAATLSSVGSTSVFLHPVEALHGDLGVLRKSDLLIALSYSGETEELLVMLTPAKRLGVRVAAITATRDSRLGKLADLTVEMPVPREACPFNLAPTTSTTALLALGDALALVLLDVHGFSKQDYGRFHPGGAIGRAVTMRVEDIMRGAGKFARVPPSATVREAICAMGHCRCGSAVVTDETGHLLGIFTDGDFRRRAGEDPEILTRPLAQVMTPHPVAVRASALAVEAVKIVEERHVDDVIAVDDENRAVGLVDVQDLPGLKLM